MDAEQLSQLAMSLRDNEVSQLVLDRIRTSAPDALVSADATDAQEINKHQATVRVVDELRGDIEGFIASGLPKKKPGLA